MGTLSLTKYECPPEVFAEISKSLLLAGKSVRFNAVGDSMFPFIHDGDLVIIEPVTAKHLQIGDIIFYEDANSNCLLHRIIRKRRFNGNSEFQIQADYILKPGGWVSIDRVFGRLKRFYRNNVWIRRDSISAKLANLLILAKLKLNLNKYNRFRSARKYFRCLPVLSRFL